MWTKKRQGAAQGNDALKTRIHRGIFPGRRRPLLFAHRGASALAPENTFEAFEAAVSVGVDVLEMDVHMSCDGEVVVIHDSTLERTTDGWGRVADKTYRELSTLDAGCRYRLKQRAARAAEPTQTRPARIPRLKDVFAAFSSAHFGIGYNIEIKQAGTHVIRAVLQVLEETAPEVGSVLLTAGRDDIMRDLEAAAPGCALGMSRGQVLQALRGAYFGRISPRLHHRALQIPPTYGGLRLATSQLIRAAHNADIEVHLWTINVPEIADRWLAQGVDGVMSDDPARIRGVVGKYKMSAEPS